MLLSVRMNLTREKTSISMGGIIYTNNNLAQPLRKHGVICYQCHSSYTLPKIAHPWSKGNYASTTKTKKKKKVFITLGGEREGRIGAL